MLLSVRSGYDARVPLSINEDPGQFAVPLEGAVKGKRIAWGASCSLVSCRSTQGSSICAAVRSKPSNLSAAASKRPYFRSISCLQVAGAAFLATGHHADQALQGHRQAGALKC